MIRGLHHAAIHVRDMDRMMAFYRDVVGLPVVWDEVFSDEIAANLTGYRGVRVRSASFLLGKQRVGELHTLELCQYLNPQPRDVGLEFADMGSKHIAVYVDDLENTYRELKERGVPFRCPPQYYTEDSTPPFVGVGETFFLDPEGNAIQLVERVDLRDGLD
jgi:catechol 2,3-dioxygenase-like lactoylglutathione lyase family enzyme